MKFLSRAIGLSTQAIDVGELLQVPHSVLGADYDAFVAEVVATLREIIAEPFIIRAASGCHFSVSPLTNS